MEEYKRLVGLFGEEGINKLNEARVAVVGLGGVGGAICTNLVRSGICHITICDFDVVEKSNINRQIVANFDNLGKMKTDCLEEMLISINPSVDVRKICGKVDETLFDQDYDLIIDAIDDVKSKIWLIKESSKRIIKIISSMGAGNKLDPTKVVKTKLSKTSYDPIAKILRRELKGIDIDCVSSVETPKKNELVSSYINVVNTFSNYLSDMAIKYILGE